MKIALWTLGGAFSLMMFGAVIAGSMTEMVYERDLAKVMNPAIVSVE